MFSDDHYALMPSISITPVMLIMAIDSLDNQFQIESKASLNQRYHAAGVAAEGSLTEPKL